MITTIQINVIGNSYSVNVGNRTERFAELEDVVRFTQLRLQRAQELRDLSSRCE